MQVTVIDYGIGNLYSVSRALERCGGEVTVTADSVQIEAASRLVLPGVGAFAGADHRAHYSLHRHYSRLSRPAHHIGHFVARS